MTPVWFLLNEPNSGRDELVFTTWSASVKGRALVRRPEFSLCVDEECPPYSFVTLHARVRELDEDPVRLRSWATRIGARYMGSERAEEYGRRNSVPGEYLVVAEVLKVIAVHGVAD